MIFGLDRQIALDDALVRAGIPFDRFLFTAKNLDEPGDGGKIIVPIGQKGSIKENIPVGGLGIDILTLEL